MKITNPKSAYLCIFAISMLGACAVEGEPEAADPVQQTARTFSDGDKVAARSLSIGDRNGIERERGPYEKAVLCSSAISSLASKFRQSAGFGDELVKGAEDAKAIYDRQISSFAESEGKTKADIVRDLKDAATAGEETGYGIRSAMACLQELQGAS